MAGQKWTVEAARETLELAGIEVMNILPINFGSQIKCQGGVSVSVFSTGKVLAQGRDAARVKALFDGATPPAWVPRELPEPRPRQAPLQASGPAASVTAVGKGSSVRIVTDYPSTRPEDAGTQPPW